MEPMEDEKLNDIIQEFVRIEVRKIHEKSDTKQNLIFIRLAIPDLSKTEYGQIIKSKPIVSFGLRWYITAERKKVDEYDVLEVGMQGEPVSDAISDWSCYANVGFHMKEIVQSWSKQVEHTRISEYPIKFCKNSTSFVHHDPFYWHKLTNPEEGLIKDDLVILEGDIDIYPTDINH